MDEVIMVENYVDHQCVRHVHLMSNSPICEDVQRQYSMIGEVKVAREGGVHHLRVQGPHYGMLDIACCVDEKKGFRRFVVWSFEGCKSVSQALREAKTEFCRLFGGAPKFAFVKKLPTGAENYMEVEGLTLLQSEWMLEKCVAVGGRQL